MYEPSTACVASISQRTIYFPKPCSMAVTKSSRRARQFAALQPRTLNVSQSAIKKKWIKLPESSQLRVKQLFRTIERSVQHRDSGAALDVQLAIDSVANMFVTLTCYRDRHELIMLQVDAKAATYAIPSQNRGGILRLRGYIKPHSR